MDSSEEQKIMDELFFKYKNLKNTSNTHFIKLDKQEYSQKPLCEDDVQGSSSKTIFKFMTTNEIYIENNYYDYAIDVDDFERNRALLLCYPEWKERLIDMSIISNRWKNLVENWDHIEELYNENYEKYGNKAYEYGECCKYIRSLISLKL